MDEAAAAATTSSNENNEDGGHDDLSASFSAQLAHVHEMFRVACDEFESIGHKMSTLKTELDRLAQLGTRLALRTSTTAATTTTTTELLSQQPQEPSSPILTNSKSTTTSSQATTQTTLDDIFHFKSSTTTTNTSFNQLVNNTDVNKSQHEQTKSSSQTSTIVCDVMSGLVDQVTSNRHDPSNEQQAAQSETNHTGVIEESIMMQEEGEEDEEPKEATAIPTSHRIEPAGVSFSTESDKENQIPSTRMITSSASKQPESSSFKEDHPSPVVAVEAINFDDMAVVSNDLNDPLESVPQDVKKSARKTSNIVKPNPQEVYFHSEYF